MVISHDLAVVKHSETVNVGAADGTAAAELFDDVAVAMDLEEIA